MYIDIVPIASAASDKLKEGKVFVVIDAFRATSTIIAALENGALEIWPVKTEEEAATYSKTEFLFAGERNAFKIPGFHFGNSPLEFTCEKVNEKKIVFTTSNGTKGIVNSIGAEEICICAYLNINAVAGFLAKKEKDIVFVCAGTGGDFTLEDFLCAGGVIHSLKHCLKHEEMDKLRLSDFALTALELYSANKDNIRGLLSKTLHYNYLMENGFEEDIDYCLQLNKSNIVATFNKGAVKKLEEEKA